MSIPPLAGYRIAVTADRRAEEQVTLLERRGAEVVVGPTVRTVPLVDGEQLSDAIDALITAPPEVVVLLTGIGTRALLAAAESTGRGEALLEALSSATVVARGPKAAGAATTAGLEVSWAAPSERSSEILDHLGAAAERGTRIAVLRDGMNVPELARALASLGADVVDVPVYRWELPEDVRPAVRVIDAIIERDVDAVTFTSAPAVRHLVELAALDERVSDLLTALASDVVAVCVGPVCAEVAAGGGIARTVVPNRARLGAMVQALAAHFDGGRRTIATSAGDVVVQRRAVFVGGSVVSVSARERALLEVLADAGGAVVPKPRLLRSVWGSGFDDDHAVEVAVGRLRRALGAVGAAVETVPRRGYRLAC